MATLTFFVLLVIGIFFLALLEWGEWKVLGTHLLIACVVTGAVGFSYELLTFHEREKALHALLDKHAKELSNTLEAYMKVSPEEVFRLLRDIASQTSQIPTLYSPARRERKEYSFANNIGYFDTLFAARSKEIQEVLRREWIQDTNPSNVKFLASDFIGKYRLCDLAGDLRQEAIRELVDWKTQWDPDKKAERSWILNYIWASSRCEEHKYGQLGELLRTAEDPWIRNWVLHIPQQMPEKEFSEMIGAYLKSNDRIADQDFQDALKALVALCLHDERDERKVVLNVVLKEARHLFENDQKRKRMVARTLSSCGLDAKEIQKTIGVE